MSLVPLDTGLYAWLAERPATGVPNAGVVIDADGITVIDTLTVPSQYEPFGAAVDALGFRVRRAVLTASTIECAGGTSHFTLAAVYGRYETSVHLDQPPNPDVLRRLYPDLAHEIDDEVTTRPVSHVVTDSVQLTPALGVHTFAGPQAENLVVVADGSGICFAGAMCSFGVTPRCYQGDPATWADELDRLIELAPIIVPGHGGIGGEEEVRELQGYLRAVVAADGHPGRVATGPWDAWLDREFDEINVERAAMVADGRDEIPTAMLRAAGLL